MLKGKVAVVTGASMGIGKGIALQLGEAGATVYVTGRKPGDTKVEGGLESTAKEVTARGGKGIAKFLDHRNADEIEQLFKEVKEEQNGQLDILINNAYSGPKPHNKGKKFWEAEPANWDDINGVALRSSFLCGVHAARLMVPRKTGLIACTSNGGAENYLFSVVHGVGKCGVDRMAADMAFELREHNVASISLWPGGITSKLETDSDKPTKGMETAEFVGKCVVHLAADPKIMDKTGKVMITAHVAEDYGFKDLDGKQPTTRRTREQVPQWHVFKNKQ